MVRSLPTAPLLPYIELTADEEEKLKQIRRQKVIVLKNIEVSDLPSSLSPHFRF